MKNNKNKLTQYLYTLIRKLSNNINDNIEKEKMKWKSF